MLYKLLVDKKSLYMVLSLFILISSIATFVVFDYNYCDAAASFKEKTEDGSMIILTSISRENTYNKSFQKNIIK